MLIKGVYARSSLGKCTKVILSHHTPPCTGNMMDLQFSSSTPVDWFYPPSQVVGNLEVLAPQPIIVPQHEAWLSPHFLSHITTHDVLASHNVELVLSPLFIVTDRVQSRREQLYVEYGSAVSVLFRSLICCILLSILGV